ncbi:hypothetical protein Bca101_019494 [Brassica carinata]
MTFSLEKGTAFHVMENEGLLETMDHLTPKLKGEDSSGKNMMDMISAAAHYFFYTSSTVSPVAALADSHMHYPMSSGEKQIQESHVEADPHRHYSCCQICTHLDNLRQVTSQHRMEQRNCLRGRVRKTEIITESGQEEELEMAEDLESETEDTSKKQRRGEGVSAEVKKMREEASCV